MAFSWWAVAESIVRKIPFDKVLVPKRDPTKALREFADTFQATESQKEAVAKEKTTIITKEPEEVAQGGSTGALTRGELDPETMMWQLEEARGELWELEAHLKHNCKGCGAAMDCCFKHSQNLIDIARETKSMTTDPIWDEITRHGEEVRRKAHPDHIRAGTYFAEFPRLVIRTSELRRPIETQLIQLSKPEVAQEGERKELLKRGIIV